MKNFNFETIWNLIGPQQNRTKCPKCRALNAYNAFMTLREKGISGDCVELGVWKGGISAMLGKLCEVYNDGKVWSFDSFEGMSKCGDFDMACDEKSVNLANNFDVQLRNFNFDDFLHTCHDIMGLKKETVTPVVGWVDQTLPVTIPLIDQIKILRIDLDWYEPTKIALESLYEKVVIGGYIICDDYGYWKGARKAIDEFRTQNFINTTIIQTPKSDGSAQDDIKTGTEHFWIKE